MLPPANVLVDELVRLIVPVPVTVRLVDVAAVQVPTNVQVPEPIPIVLVLLLLADTAPEAPDKVTLYVTALKVPAVIVSAEAEATFVIKASCKVTDPLGVLIVNNCVNVLLALVIVWLPRPEKINVPEPDSVVPVPLTQLP